MQAQKLDVHGLSIPGTDHKKNHDHFAIATLNKSMRLHQSNLSIDDESRVHGHNQGHLFLVADGIGGAPAPARASGEAVDSVVHYFLNEMPWYHLADGDPADVTLALQDAIHNAQDELLTGAAPHQTGMGTTMTLAFLLWPDLYLAHVGDSRCYLSRGRDLERLTTDHTLAQVRREAGGKVTKRARNVLWNAVGGQGSEVQPDVRHVRLQTGDVLALVTDGVTGETPDRELERALSLDLPSAEVCDRILRGSGRDDRTAIVVRFLPLEDEPAVVPAAPDPSSLRAEQERRLPKIEPRDCGTLRKIGEDAPENTPGDAPGETPFRTAQ